ncbi:MAG: hypothetical protein Q4Q58_03020 [Thermoplasmata archaeon]|nr:hypothetical protein [Thermoplasmata archaeon]
MSSEFTAMVRRDLGSIGKVVAIAAGMGCFMCLFVNNLSISAISMNPAMGATSLKSYTTMAGAMHTFILGMGSAAFLWILPGMRGRKADDSPYGMKSGLAAICVAALAVEILILLVHCALVIVKNGSMDGYEFLPLIYLGFFFLDLFFAGMGLLGHGLSDSPKKALGMAGGVGGWCLLMSMMALLGTSSFVMIGAGAEWCTGFRAVTIFGLMDVDSLMTIGTSAVDYSCVWEILGILVIAAIVIAAGWHMVRRKSPEAA